MKKKVLAMILAASVIFSLCACNKEQPTQGETKKEAPTEVEEIEENGDDTENSGKDATSNNESPSVGEISVEGSGSVSENSECAIHVSVRPAGTKGKNWTDLLEVNVGDEVEYQIEYDNTSNETQHDVILRDYLPNNVEYIPGTTRLYNDLHDGDVYDSDRLFTDDGIHIGSYEAGINGYIRFNAKIVDKDLKCGSNTLVNWGQGWVGDQVVQDYANVHLNKE